MATGSTASFCRPCSFQGPCSSSLSVIKPDGSGGIQPIFQKCCLHRSVESSVEWLGVDAALVSDPFSVLVDYSSIFVDF